MRAWYACDADVLLAVRRCEMHRLLGHDEMTFPPPVDPLHLGPFGHAPWALAWIADGVHSGCHHLADALAVTKQLGLLHHDWCVLVES